MTIKKYAFVAFFSVSIPLLAQSAESWADKIKLSGDFRYRHELISEETGSASSSKRVPDRNRHRLRGRLALQAKVNDVMDVNIRIASSTFDKSLATADPISTNQDLGAGSSPKPIWLDRAYVEYHPGKSILARAGKSGVPFEGTDLLWDGDLNLEGIAVLANKKMDKSEMFARFGGFWGAERKSSDGPDQGLFCGQIGGNADMGLANALLAVGYYDYGNVRHNPLLYNPAKSYGNYMYYDSSRSAWLYASDFNELDINGRVKFKQQKVETTVLADYVMNTGAEENAAGDKKDTGWLAGIALKFNKTPVDWEFAYNYRELNADAVLAAFTDSDHVGGGTNFSGHKVSGAFSVLPNAKLVATYFRDTKDPDGAKLAYNRFMADVEVKF